MTTSISQADLARMACLQLRGVGAKAVLASFAKQPSEEITAEDALRSYAPERPEHELQAALTAVCCVVEKSRQAGVEILPYSHPLYPAPFRTLRDAPPFLYAKGLIPREWTNAVAVVGTREPSEYAVEMTCRVVDSLSARPETIVVSGLALGIDSMAHERSLLRNLRTTAVLANGLDTVYPKKSAPLAEKILAEGGCLLSETPTGYGVTKFNLALRDRLQSGLSRAILVMQSSITGGTMHTALFTLEQERTLIVLKPPNDEDVWSGSWFMLGKVKDKWLQERPSLEKFKRFRQPWAYPLTEAKLDDFIRAAIASNFTPRTNGGNEKGGERCGRVFTQVQLALA